MYGHDIKHESSHRHLTTPQHLWSLQQTIQDAIKAKTTHPVSNLCSQLPVELLSSSKAIEQHQVGHRALKGKVRETQIVTQKFLLKYDH